MSYFQIPGRAEAEIELDVRAWIAGMYTGLSSETLTESSAGAMFMVPPGALMSDRFPRGAALPPWLSDADLDFYADEFERTGFRGALNRYRNMDRDWEDLAAWDGAAIGVPSLFIGGGLDPVTIRMSSAIRRHETTMPELRGSHVLPDTGHWVQQEQPDTVNELLVDWLHGL